MSKYVNMFFLLFLCICYSKQDIMKSNDSLKSKSYYDLSMSIYRNLAKGDTISVERYAYYYLKRALRNNDSTRIAEAYHYIAASSKNDEILLKYLDLSLVFSNNNESFIVPSSTYLTKSVIYSKKSNYKKALDFFLLAHQAAKRVNNENYLYIAKYNIGIIKSRIGLHNEALKYAEECWKYSNRIDKSDNHLDYLALLSNEYSYTGKLEQSSKLNKIGIDEALKTDNKELYNLFVTIEGVNLFFKKEFKLSINSLNKSLPYFIRENNKVYEASIYYYLGKSYYAKGEKKLALKSFKKVDSISLLSDGLLPNCRESYNYLIENSKNVKDLKSQLYYTEQLLRFDSLLLSNYQYISSTIYNEHETPILIAEKEVIINKLKRNNKSYVYYMITLFIIVFTVVIFLVINYKKKRLYKEKFNELMMNESKFKDKQSDKNISIIEENNNDIDIDSEIVKIIIEKLEYFETNKLYLVKGISLSDLSEKFDINSKYISKIINAYKDKTVSQYINSLRLEYCIERLKEDSKFRKYTIDYIADESGFGTRRSFNSAFVKKTGISPSYFIKNISS